MLEDDREERERNECWEINLEEGCNKMMRMLEDMINEEEEELYTEQKGGMEDIEWDDGEDDDGEEE